MCIVTHMSSSLTGIDPYAIADLHRRLDSARAARLPQGLGWSRGVDADALASVLHHWRHEFDAESFDARVRALPWEVSGSLRVVHQRAALSDAPAVVLLHGWPDSVLRFERILPLLGDVNVVVPALPGFPFARDPASTGASVVTMADAVAQAMESLGYHRYVVSGGDFGADVAEHLATQHPGRVTALHLTNVSPLHAVFADRTVLDEESLVYLDTVARWSRSEGAYIAEQSTKPHTLAAALADTPAGLAAWILEKLHAWADAPFASADAAAWISAYWFTNSIGSSFTTYAEFAPPVGYVSTPTILSSFANDTKPAPLSFAARFVNVCEHIEHERGGHFAAWEQPEAYVADLRRATRLDRS